MKYYVINSFTDELFKGNPAGVCIVDREISDFDMQKIANENNLSETAFLNYQNDCYSLRWFTPETEIDLCGHATLATAFVIFNFIKPKLTKIDFQTKSGKLTVSKEKDLLQMDFPSRIPMPIKIDDRLNKAFGCDILSAHQSRDLLLIFKNEETVKNLKPDFELLKKIDDDIDFSIIVSAKGENCDFVSRFFIPNSVIKEDPVTGSAHCTLIPYWSNILNKKEMIAKQLSKRGGTLYCFDKNDRVLINGQAKLYFCGEIIY